MRTILSTGQQSQGSAAKSPTASRALHAVKIVHGDLKADNILLFTDPDDENGLIGQDLRFRLLDRGVDRER